MKISGLGDIGLITDRDAHDLPPNAWNVLNNLRCKNGAIEPIDGYTDLTTLTPPGSTQDLHIHQFMQVEKDGTVYTVYAYDSNDNGIANKIYQYNGTSHTEITRAAGGDYGNSVNEKWSVCSFGGLLVFNNGYDAPQWTDGTSQCQPLPFTASKDWGRVDDASTKNIQVKTLRSMGNYLIGLHVTEGGTDYPQMLIWSSPAAAGNVPASWDYTDSAEDASRVVLTETEGYIYDAATLGESLIVYKEDSIYRMNFIGGQFVFDVDLITTSHGLWAPGCLVDVGNMHVCIGEGVVYTFDGSRPVNILEGKNAKQFFDSINASAYDRVFATHNPTENEVWFCYPSIGSEWANKALIWNYGNDTWYNRDLPSSSVIRASIIGGSNPLAETYNSFTTETETAFEGLTWATQSFSPVADQLLGAGTQFVQYGQGVIDGTIDGFTPYARRDGLVLGNPDDWFMVRRIMPHASGGPFRFVIGTQEVIDGSVAWDSGSTGNFDPGTDYKLDQRLSSRVFAIQIFGTTGGDTWRLDSYTVDAVPVGKR